MVCDGLFFSHTPQVILAGFSTGILFFQLPSTALTSDLRATLDGVFYFLVAWPYYWLLTVHRLITVSVSVMVMFRVLKGYG